MSLVALLDPQLAAYIVIALVPNLLIILWAMARLSHDLRLLKQKNAMLEDDINLLDQSISSLTGEFQAIRKLDGSLGSGRLTGQKE